MAPVWLGQAMAGGDQRWNPEREVRLAIVMYGGVSLAIYIYGVAQELERLVRATAPAGDRKSLHLSDDDLKSTDAVYREIGRKLGGDDAEDWGTRDGDKVRSRFVIDILSGTSAGGINAIYLAKAMANGQTIAALRDLWIAEADIDLLLNEEAAYEGLAPGVSFSKPPKSLLASQRLYVRALQSLAAMGDARAAQAPHYADQVDLAVTTTDLQGLTMPVQLADGGIEEPRHRTMLRFGYTAKNTADDARNEYEHRDELLAFAARATSSFPFAFEPARLRDAELAMSRSLDEAPLAEYADDLFPDYARIEADYKSFAFADGGYLDNKPFTGATEELRRRRADLPVTRKLLYVEPDPVNPAKYGDPKKAKPAPDPIGNIGDALVALPRFEPIREDIGAIGARNAAVERIRQVTRDVELTAVDPRYTIDAPAVLRLSYLRLRRMQVVEDLTGLVARTSEEPPSAEAIAAVREQIEAWAPEGGEEEAELHELTEFLADFDLPYRLRRIALLHDRVNDLIAGGDKAARLLAAAHGAPKGEWAERAAELAGNQEAADWLRGRKVELNRIQIEVRRLGRRARKRYRPDRPDKSAPEVVVTAANAMIAAPGEDRAEALANALRENVSSDLRETDVELEKAFAEAPEPRPDEFVEVLTRYLGCVEAIDMAVFPLTYPDLGETNPVAVYRVSPEDATSLVDRAPGDPPKLAGVAVAHFGGFLDQAWRRSDMMWGRLDAAERLIDVLVPVKAERAALRIRAHAQILREEAAGPDSSVAGLLSKSGGDDLLRAIEEGAPDERIVAIFKSTYEARARKLPQETTFDLAGRSAIVAGDVIGAAVKARKLPLGSVTWAASRGGREFWRGRALVGRAKARAAGVGRWIRARF